MTSTYPDNIDYFTQKVDSSSDCRAGDINDVQDSITAMQTALGILPQGQNQPVGWTVADRLSVFINDNGTLKKAVITSSDIPSGSITNTKIYHNDTFYFSGSVINNLLIDGIARWRGSLIPDTNLTYDLGSPTNRINIAYIDTVLGRATGGETLTVTASASFDNTIIIRASTDTTSGDSIASIGIKSNDLYVQSAVGTNLNLQPYGGTVLLPRFTTTQRNAIASPLESMLIYNTTTKSMNYYNGTAWVDVANYSV